MLVHMRAKGIFSRYWKLYNVPGKSRRSLYLRKIGKTYMVSEDRTKWNMLGNIYSDMCRMVGKTHLAAKYYKAAKYCWLQGVLNKPALRW